MAATVAVTASKDHSAASYILVPAVAMCLGWGLRGYIGGGPFGAMIPGAFVALVLCLFLGYGPRAAAFAAAFGAVGVGFGGNETYGQTIGLLRSNETLAWGLVGLGLKGAVWGLLGGAVLGTGLCAHRLESRKLLWALVWLTVGVFVGIAIINEPKLIYFSNREDRPRDECWAGILLGALGYLGYLSLRARDIAECPKRFAQYGAVAGGLGFFTGALFMVYGLRAPEALKWMPYWKYMEFTFGFLFGGGLGLCAYTMRDKLRAWQRESDVEPAPKPWPMPAAYIASVALVAAVFFIWPFVARAISGGLRELEGLRFLLNPLGEALLSYFALGCILIYLSRRSELMAWQTAATVTLVASVIDLVGDWREGERGVTVAPTFTWTIVIVTLLVSSAAVLFWQRRTGQCLYRMTILLMWALVGVSFFRAFSGGDIVSPSPTAVAEAGGTVWYVLRTLEGRSIVQTVFTVTAIVTTWAILRIKSCGGTGHACAIRK